MSLSSVTNFFIRTPRTLFLVDGLGAGITAFSLFFILRNFYDLFGMPKHVLSYLALIALLFCVYSSACFFFLRDNWTPFLKAISIANLAYCALTMVASYVYFTDLTKLGLSYFFFEVCLIITLVYVELSVAVAVAKKQE